MKPVVLRRKFLILLLIFSVMKFCCQTALSAGDIAVIAIKTNGNTQSGNDAIKLVTLVDLQCNTQFIITDNNWNGTSWACNDDEFGVQVTCNSIIPAGSIFYLDADGSGGALTCSGGSVSKTNLGSPWGSNFGLNSGGDNIYVLQGTRASPTFIYAFKHNGSFSSATCSNKDNAALPSGLSLGTSAIVMSSAQDQWNFNCVTHTGTKATILSAIGNTSNWASNTSHIWDATNGLFKVTSGFFSFGTLAVSGAGCGCLANCQLAYYGSTNCGSGVGGNCTSGYQNMTATITVPSGCTYNVIAEMKNRNYGCTASGADGNCQTCDVVKVDVAGGSKIFQQGGSNSSLSDSYSSAGPANIIVSGRADRADEIITYSIQVTPCTCLTNVLPVVLSEFKGRLVERSVELSWITLSETNNRFFSLQRSADSENWETIYVIAGQNYLYSTHNYKTYDSSPLSGISYYRLKQTDGDGSFSYSDIVVIDNIINDSFRKIVRRVNIYGQVIDENATGLIFLIYDNGEVRKTFIN